MLSIATIKTGPGEPAAVDQTYSTFGLPNGNSVFLCACPDLATNAAIMFGVRS